MDRWDVFVWILAPGAVAAALAATVVCVRKGRRVWAAIGIATTALAATVMVGSWTASSESFGDLVVAIAFIYAVVPLLLITIFGATRRAVPGSRWLERRSSPPADHR